MVMRWRIKLRLKTVLNCSLEVLGGIDAVGVAPFFLLVSNCGLDDCGEYNTYRYLSLVSLRCTSTT